jgi:hypothetical protein
LAVCGALALAAACSSGAKRVSSAPATNDSPGDSSVTVSSTKAAKRAATKHATKSAGASSSASTTSGSTGSSGTGTTTVTVGGSAAAPTVSVAVPTTWTAGTSSQFVVGPIASKSTPTTVKPFDPTKTVDLSGTPGVTPEEQARAEALVRETLLNLPKYANPATAYADGYRSIHDHIPGITNDEHYVKWAYLDDGRLLDSKHPESLVYEFPNGQPKLVAAMYIMPLGSRFTDVPDVGGALTQWHVHNNLCLVDDPSDPLAKIISGLVEVDQACPAGTSKASVPMLHVWIVANPCGPFSALEGIGAGQVPDGETRLCDTLHGS